MIKSLFLNIAIIAFIVIVYYFNLLEFLTSNYFIWILIALILLLFATAFKVLGNPFKQISKDKDTKEED